MPVTSNDIANQSLQLVGDNQPRITGNAPNFDDSTAGKALKELYAPCVATVARRFAWDFARKTSALVLSGNTPPPPFALEYLYPANCVQIWQLMPAALADPNNPLPTTWNVANNQVLGVQTKVIQTDLAGALAVFNNNPSEDTWDAGFREAVVRLLASELAMAIAGKPDVAQAFLESAAGFENVAEKRTD